MRLYLCQRKEAADISCNLVLVFHAFGNSTIQRAAALPSSRYLEGWGHDRDAWKPSHRRFDFDLKAVGERPAAFFPKGGSDAELPRPA